MNLNIQQLPKTAWLEPVDTIFDRLKGDTLDYDNPIKRRVFIDRGAKVLFMAHLDTVQPPKFYKIKNQRLYASGLDDRLGCYIAYKLSQELDVDLLLTDHEESGQTTAMYHTFKDYNWICEFDRAGDDVVHYGLVNRDWLDALETTWKAGHGVYSDICSIKTDACCMNLGIGYNFAHSKDSYVDIPTCNDQIDKFVAFYHKHKDTRFEIDGFYAEQITPYQYPYGYKVARWNDDDLACEICGAPAETIYGRCLCDICFHDMFEYYAQTYY